MKKAKALIAALLSIVLVVLAGVGCDIASNAGHVQADLSQLQQSSNGRYYINEEGPNFSESDLASKKSFESYSKLDWLGRCGVAFANLGLDLMPTSGRESIYEIKPTGWHSVDYPNMGIKGDKLYNRCHLIAFRLAGENANDKNLITGTRQMNETMGIFEDIVDKYIKGTGNHVFYRVTPDFRDRELVARGVLMEAQSVEDGGKGVKFNVYIPNEQQGIGIDYSDGDSWLL